MRSSTARDPVRGGRRRRSLALATTSAVLVLSASNDGSSSAADAFCISSPLTATTRSRQQRRRSSTVPRMSSKVTDGGQGGGGHQQEMVPSEFPLPSKFALHVDPFDPFSSSSEGHEGAYEAAMQKLNEPVPTYGMPWETSISKNPDDPLLYMDFWRWQSKFMEENLTDLRPVRIPDEFSYRENKSKKARIVNLAFRSKEYRKIRMTYYDAGVGCQVFNSLWYPDASYDLPVLGIDLLAFGRKRHLAVVDFQPLHDCKSADDGSWGHEIDFEGELLGPIRKKYGELQGKMSAKFYDETKFFSKQMLFSRFEKESVVKKTLFPAYREYVGAHVAMTKGGVRNHAAAHKQKMLDRQSAFDTYSAERDPATGLFAQMFGSEWADRFVYDYLFSSSRPVPGVMAGSLAKRHGPPPSNNNSQGGNGNPGAPPQQSSNVPQRKKGATARATKP